jgi:predicted nucleic-acid-binding protein
VKALDTNAIVRYLVRDDETQAQAVRRALLSAEEKQTPLFIPTVVILEVIWVLASSYGFSRDSVTKALESLLALPAVHVEDGDAVAEVCRLAHNAAGELPDLLIGICARRRGCDGVLTFDKRAARTGLFELIR